MMRIEVNPDTLGPHTEDDDLGWVLVRVIDRDSGLVDLDARPTSSAAAFAGHLTPADAPPCPNCGRTDADEPGYACGECGARGDGEPTDDEIYNGPGREGGISYGPDDSPGSLGENDYRL
jgi:hypothetical protein